MPNFEWDWHVNVGTVFSIFTTAGALLLGLGRMFWNAHKENQGKLGVMSQEITELKGEIKPISKWFQKNVLER